MRIKFYNELLATYSDDHPMFVISFDYRGFGHSTGTPSEQGLITDGVATVNLVLEKLQITAERIVLVGHSLGTAVATATYDHFLRNDESNVRRLAGLVLASGFTDVPSLLTEYHLGGFLPVLGPLKAVPWLLRWFQRRLIDTWDTRSRIRMIVESDEAVNLVFVHSKNDWEIPARQSEELFLAAVGTRTGESTAVARSVLGVCALQFDRPSKFRCSLALADYSVCCSTHTVLTLRR